MERVVLAAASAACVMIFSLAPGAQDSAPAPKAASDAPATRLSDPFEGLGLSDLQRRRITDIQELGRKTLAEWNAANAEKKRAALGALDAAEKTRDKDAIDRANKELSDLLSEQSAIVKKTQRDLMAALTGPQKAQYYENQAVGMVLGRFSPAVLSEEQTARVRAAYREIFSGANPEDWMTNTAGLRKLIDLTESDILTDAQRMQVMKSSATRPAGAGRNVRPPAAPPAPAPKAQ